MRQSGPYVGTPRRLSIAAPSGRGRGRTRISRRSAEKPPDGSLPRFVEPSGTDPRPNSVRHRRFIDRHPFAAPFDPALGILIEKIDAASVPAMAVDEHRHRPGGAALDAAGIVHPADGINALGVADLVPVPSQSVRRMRRLGRPGAAERPIGKRQMLIGLPERVRRELDHRVPRRPRAVAGKGEMDDLVSELRGTLAPDQVGPRSCAALAYAGRRVQAYLPSMTFSISRVTSSMSAMPSTCRRMPFLR